MTEAPRYTVIDIDGRMALLPEGQAISTADWDSLERLHGRAVILAEDHVAALAAEREFWNGQMHSASGKTYEQGQKDALDNVEAILSDPYLSNHEVYRRIRALSKTP